MGFGTALLRTWELVEDKGLSVAGDRITFAGLDLDADRWYLMMVTLYNPTAGDVIGRLFFNGDETVTNYYYQHLWGDGGSASAARGNDAICVTLPAGMCLSGFIYINRSPDGYPRALLTGGHRDPSVCRVAVGQIVRTVKENVTRIDGVAGVAGGFGKGTRIILYRLGG